MHMRPLPQTLAIVQDAGLEIVSVEGMREHYVRTFQAWRDTLDARFAEAEALLGPQRTGSGAYSWRAAGWRSSGVRPE